MGKITTIQGVRDAVNETAAETLGVDVSTIRPESNLIDDLGGDSLDAVELVMALEEKFDIEIPEDEAESIRTVSDIYDVVAGKLHIS